MAQVLRTFLRENRLPLHVATGWLLFVWGAVLAADYFYNGSFALDTWAGNWDGGWYRSIVESGYSSGPIDHQTNVAFFPLLPTLVWLVSKVSLLPVVWAGMLVSTVSFAAALVMLWHFVNKFFTRKVAVWTLLIAAFNPFSLYFGMVYTESLFLLLAVTTFWFIYNKHWWWAAFFAGLATATRSVGVALSVAVIVGWFASGLRKKKVRAPWFVWLPKMFALTVLSLSGLIIFSWYMWRHTGDPAAYSTVQQFWPGRGGLANVGAELVYLWEHKVVNMQYALTVMWYVSGAIAFVGLALIIRMRQWLMALYSAIALSLPVIFGTFTGMNRYVLVVFPVFIAYAALVIKWPGWLQVVVLALSIAALGGVIFLMADPRGFFIA